MSGPLSIISTLPSDNSTNVSIFQKIDVVFSRPLTESEKNSVVLTGSPVIQGGQQWANSKTLSLSPKLPLTLNQQYLLTITYLNKKYNWKFKTVQLKDVSQTDKDKAQSIGDQNFDKQYQEIYKKYPWYQKLPILTSVFFAYFDTNKKIFVIKVYVDSKSDVLQNTQIESIKIEATKRLKDVVGNDILKYDTEWEIVTK
ncbi:MAG: hypothetical protein A2905_04940 [Candidatus Levybacteria bacterium RIFCSPLOWO2_01_FULL_36_10]|nr:MAG: hypothetical protein A2905_04940 [Candidatus Levybacteria bacterium RIFCSPLOWO2_01_FULL_36_10]